MAQKILSGSILSPVFKSCFPGLRRLSSQRPVKACAYHRRAKNRTEFPAEQFGSRLGTCRLSATSRIEQPEKAEELASIPFEGVVFDMDGTLTVSNIDFNDMRSRTGISKGDLFTVMESWDGEEEITEAMEVILELEAEARKSLTLKEGLESLLELLKKSKVHVALVTRNTTPSVDAFFSILGEEWRPLFSQVLTREDRYVKPDRRLLIDVAKAWGLPPASLLMVGDSTEDVECGNAAGTATCLIKGGGNETAGGSGAAPVGAVPTFAVATLSELRDRLRDGDVASGEAHAGEAAPGTEFFSFLCDCGAIRSGGCSFPRLAEFGGGMVAVGEPGERVLHLQCGAGGLTKLLASQGLTVVGADTEVDAALARGLTAKKYLGEPLSRMSLGSASGSEGFDVVFYYGSDDHESRRVASLLARDAAAEELWRVVKLGGRVCLELAAGAEEAAAVEAALARRGFLPVLSEAAPSSEPRHRAVVRKPGMTDFRARA